MIEFPPMRARIEAIVTGHTPDTLGQALQAEPGLAILRTGQFDVPGARYSFVATQPALQFRSYGTRCEVLRAGAPAQRLFGNPWELLRELLATFEISEESRHPFPLGGVFGYWGFELKQFTEPRLTRRAVNDLELPDCHVGFYTSLVVFDHSNGNVWMVATGLNSDGEHSRVEQEAQLGAWRERLNRAVPPGTSWSVRSAHSNLDPTNDSSMTRQQFLAALQRAQKYIRAGDIYQVNLAQRLRSPCLGGAWEFWHRLVRASPAPFSAFYDAGDFALVSSSPELFLHLSDRRIVTRPIKGTRPRHPDPVRDQILQAELLASEKERSELVMITDLLRNDLGRICDYGTVHVPELFRLEQFPQVQHLVSTVEGRLRAAVSHLDALASCFPGGSITGAPKIRALEIIDELEPVARGPYCGCHGFLGFNRESQLSITIRTAVVRGQTAWFHVGAGIVADSIPEAEYDETLAKARGLLSALAGAAPLALPDAELESLVPLTDADP
jgi:para-aminobenzoate synthetase component 1